VPLVALAFVSLCGAVRGSASPQDSAPVGQTADLMSQGMSLAAQGQLAQAELLLEKARQTEPKNAEVLTALAKVKDREGELPAAIAIFREVANATPRSTEAHLNLAMALADNGDLNGALPEVSRAVELSPKLASAHLNRARILADLRRAEDARAEFVIASRLAPANPDCYFYWALVEKEKDNYVKESDLLRTVIRLQPDNEKALNLLGQSLFDESKEQEAVAVWRRVLRINPDSSEATYSLSLALRNTEPQESKRLMARFHELQEREKLLHQVNTLGNQAYTEINDRRWPEAIATLREGIRLCGDCQMQATFHKDLGLALCYSGELHEGETELRTALRLNPADPDILKALATISHQ
jgi:protein O-GlcNAc transferase